MLLSLLGMPTHRAAWIATLHSRVLTHGRGDYDPAQESALTSPVVAELERHGHSTTPPHESDTVFLGICNLAPVLRYAHESPGVPTSDEIRHQIEHFSVCAGQSLSGAAVIFEAFMPISFERPLSWMNLRGRKSRSFFSMLQQRHEIARLSEAVLALQAALPARHRERIANLDLETPIVLRLPWPWACLILEGVWSHVLVPDHDGGWGGVNEHRKGRLFQSGLLGHGHRLQRLWPDIQHFLRPHQNERFFLNNTRLQAPSSSEVSTLSKKRPLLAHWRAAKVPGN